MPGRLVGADRRRRRPARLGADPVDPRAAHPAREGDQQHLHQFRAVRARLHDPPGAARRGGASPGWRGSTMRRPCSSPSGSRRVPGVTARQRQLLQRIRRAAAEAGGGGGRDACRQGHPRRRAGQPLLSGARRSRRSAAGRGDRDVTRRGHRPSRRAGLRRCCDERVEPGAQRATRQPRARAAPTISGNRGLQIEEPLLFEQDSPGRMRRRSARAAAGRDRARRARTRRGRSACRVSASRRWCATITRLSQKNYAIDSGPLPARLVHDEAQPAPQREDGAAARFRRYPSAAAGIDRARARSS